MNIFRGSFFRGSFFRHFRSHGHYAMFVVPVLGFSAMGCHGFHHRKEVSEKELREDLKSHTEDVLERVDASKEQVQSIQAIVDGMVPDVLALRGEKKRLRDELQKALTAEKVDRQEVERIRREAVSLFDKASTRLADAATRSSEVLTPQQRRDLVSKWKRFSR